MSFLQKLVLYTDTNQQTKFESKIRKYEYMGMHWTLAGHDFKNQKNFGNLTFMLLCRNWAKKQFLMSLHGFSIFTGVISNRRRAGNISAFLMAELTDVLEEVLLPGVRHACRSKNGR